MATIKERFQNVAKKLTNDVLLRRPLELEQADLQRALASRFPLRREGTVTLQFADPFVRLDCGEDRMGLELSISARLLGAMTPATRWLVIGELKYQRENGWFTLGQPDLHYITAANLPSGAGPGRRFVTADILGPMLSDLPIYQLRTTDTRQALARKYLHTIRVSDGKLVLWLRA